MASVEVPDSSDVEDLFKEEFKRYKKCSENEIRNVIDVTTPERFTNEVRVVS